MSIATRVRTVRDTVALVFWSAVGGAGAVVGGALLLMAVVVGISFYMVVMLGSLALGITPMELSRRWNRWTASKKTPRCAQAPDGSGEHYNPQNGTTCMWCGKEF